MRSALKISNRMNLFSMLCLLLFMFSYATVEAQGPPSVDKAGEAAEVIFHLRVPLRFADGREVKSIAKSEIDGLRELRVSFGANVDIESVRLEKKKDKRKTKNGKIKEKQVFDVIEVRTCREYEAALKSGYSPENNMERKLASFLKYPCAVLKALEIASVAEESFIRDVGVANVELLPFTVFPVLGEYKSRQAFAKDLQTTYQQKIEAGELVVRESTEHVLKIAYKGVVQSLREIVRADFNNDGLEDVLVSEGNWVRQGTYSAYGLIVLTRKSLQGKFEVARPLDPRQSPYFFDSTFE